MTRTFLAAIAALVLLVACGTTRSDPPRSGGVITLLDDDAADTPFVIERGTITDALLKGPSWFIRQVAVQPVLLGDQFYGFRIRALFPGHPEFVEDAIRTGDIVQRVNGMPIERPDQFMTVWNALGDARHLSIRVVRDGKPLLVTWLIRDEDDLTTARR